MDRKDIISRKTASELVVGSLAGFSLFWLTSHQKSPINRKLPKKRYKSFHYSPHLKVERADKHYHLHHWALFGVTYLPLIFLRRKIKSKLLHGFFIGSIIQGLTYSDRFKFIKPMENFEKQPVIDDP